MKFDITKVNEVYADYNIQLAEAKKINEQTVFQYETPAGNKDARSYIYKLRQSKSSIDKARKGAKQESLEYGRMIDTEGKRLISEIDAMINVHETPLKAIAEREKLRIAEIEVMVVDITVAGNAGGVNSIELQKVYDHIFSLDIKDDYAEFKEKALLAKDATLKRLAARIQIVKKQEAEQAELERLRKEKIEREQKEHDERIAREAKAKAERKAHEEAVRKELEEKEIRERTERERQVELDRVEREKQQAIDNAKQAQREQIAQEERAKIEKKQAVERQNIAVEQAKQTEIDRQDAEKKLMVAEQARREANKRHIGNIRRDAKESIMELGINEQLAKQLVMAIHNHEIANVTIKY